MKTRQQIRLEKYQLKRDNAKAPNVLTELDKSLWPAYPFSEIINIFRSNKFVVQVFQEKNSVRLSINRTEMDNKGQWKDGISWEEIQKIKEQVGYGDHLAVEIYPKDKDIVNVSNMRHLWLPDFEIDFGWKKFDENVRKRTFVLDENVEAESQQQPFIYPQYDKW